MTELSNLEIDGGVAGPCCVYCNYKFNTSSLCGFGDVISYLRVERICFFFGVLYYVCFYLCGEAVDTVRGGSWEVGGFVIIVKHDVAIAIIFAA